MEATARNLNPALKNQALNLKTADPNLKTAAPSPNTVTQNLRVAHIHPRAVQNRSVNLMTRAAAVQNHTDLTLMALALNLAQSHHIHTQKKNQVWINNKNNGIRQYFIYIISILSCLYHTTLPFYILVFDPCDPDPCVRGTCESSDEGYRCDCEEGWTGRHCDEGMPSG